MKRLKKILITWGIGICLCGILCGAGYLKYLVWRAEHPQAKTWTFYIPQN